MKTRLFRALVAEWPFRDRTILFFRRKISLQHSRLHHLQPDPIIARSRVFATYELTENILNQLPLPDLITATAVCPYWHTIIHASQPLRTRLIEEPVPTWYDLLSPTRLHNYNINNGTHWLVRVYPITPYDALNPCIVLILRTPTIHIELLVHETPLATAPRLDPPRTCLFGTFGDDIQRVDGFDLHGEIAWQAVYEWRGLSAWLLYDWNFLAKEASMRYVASKAKERRDVRAWVLGKWRRLRSKQKSLWDFCVTPREMEGCGGVVDWGRCEARLELMAAMGA